MKLSVHSLDSERESRPLRLSLGVNTTRPVGAVVRRRRNRAPDGGLLVAPP